MLVSDLHRINNMYRFSLAYFTHLFLSCLEQKDQTKLKLDDRGTKTGKLEAAELLLNKICFNNIASSLFKADRLSFGIYLLRGINPETIPER